jgi:hypothetical protein
LLACNARKDLQVQLIEDNNNNNIIIIITVRLLKIKVATLLQRLVAANQATLAHLIQVNICTTAPLKLRLSCCSRQNLLRLGYICCCCSRVCCCYSWPANPTCP